MPFRPFLPLTIRLESRRVTDLLLQEKPNLVNRAFSEFPDLRFLSTLFLSYLGSGVLPLSDPPLAPGNCQASVESFCGSDGKEK